MLTSFTINGPSEKIKEMWHHYPNKQKPTVTIEEAPSGRGSIIRLKEGRSAAAREILRRFKQFVETGEILITDGQPAARSHSLSSKYDRYAA